MTFATATEFALGAAAYGSAALLYFADLWRTDAQPGLGAWARRALAAGAVLHAAHVVSTSLIERVCPVTSAHFALSLSALVAVTTFLIVGPRRGASALGACVAPIGVAFLVGAQFTGTEPAPSVASTGLLALHVAANLAGVGVYLIAGVAGVVYLAEERRLKAKKLGRFAGGKLPPLDVLDRTVHRMLLVGFPLLTLGVVTGAYFGVGTGSTASVVRFVFGWVTWGLLASVLVLRAAMGWRGRRVAYGAIAGVSCILLVLAVYAVRSGAAS